MKITAETKLPLQDENIVILENPKDAREVIDILSTLLEKQGVVKPSFREAVWEREQNMPTGLELEGDFHAAIPHADIEHVNKPSLALAVLKHPVRFRCMVEPEKELDVRLVFLLAMDEPKKQIEMLQQVSTILQDAPLIKSLSVSNSAEEVMKFISIHNTH
ncbi:MAG: PTS sugar transporter subunit IIA [Anaerolineales bacterium]